MGFYLMNEPTMPTASQIADKFTALLNLRQFTCIHFGIDNPRSTFEIRKVKIMGCVEYETLMCQHCFNRLMWDWNMEYYEYATPKERSELRAWFLQTKDPYNGKYELPLWLQHILHNPMVPDVVSMPESLQHRFDSKYINP